jgi:hypothetical protein
MWRVGFIEERRKNCLPLLHVQGKEKGEQCRFERHCFFFFLNMERRRFIYRWRQHLFPKSVLNLSFVLLSPHNVILILRINSIASLPISVSAL